MKKRLLSLLLVCVMLLGVFPATALAEGNSDAGLHQSPVAATGAMTTSGYYKDVTWNAGTPTKTVPYPSGIVSLNKTATSVEGSPNTYDITLTVKTETATTTVGDDAATTLVLDESTSMDNKIRVGSGMDDVALLNKEYGGKEGIYTIRINWTSTGISGYTYPLRYNTESNQWEYDPLIGNWKALEGSGWESKTRSIYVSRVNAMKIAAKEFVDAYASDTATRWLSIVTFGNEATTVLDWTNISSTTVDTAKQAIERISIRDNTGTNLEQGLATAAALADSDTISAVQKSGKYVIALTDGKPTFAYSGNNKIGNGSNTTTQVTNATYATASTLKDKINTLYGIDFSGGSATTVMQNVASEGKCYTATTASDLTFVFANLNQTITSGTTGQGLTVTDPMGAYVAYQGTTDTGFVVNTNGVGTWTLGTGTQDSDGNYVHTLTYRITVNADDPAFEENKFYPANGVTYLTYGDDQVNFPVPGVKGVKTDYTVKYNLDGGTQGAATDKLETTGLHVGDNTPKVTNPTKSGWTFTGWTPTVQDTVQAANADTNHVITYTATWEKNTYTLTYNPQGGHWNGTDVPTGYTKNTDGTISKEVLKGSDLEALLTGNDLPVYDGYTFNGWLDEPGGNPVDIDALKAIGVKMNRNFTFYADWIKDDDTPDQGNTVSITVKEHYRLDGEEVYTSSVPNSTFLDTQTYTDVIAALTGTGTRAYNGRTYTYTSAKVNNAAAYIGKVKNNDIIDLYFDCTTGKAGYVIAYYRLGEDKAFETTTVSAQTIGTVIAEDDATVLAAIKSHTPEGYHLKNVQTLPLTISANATDNLIKVYYEKDYVDYFVWYYYDGEQDSSKNEHLYAQFGDEITSYPDKAGTGYVLDHVDTLPLVISTTATNNVIKVYYKSCGYTVTKTVDKTAAKVGDTLTYTITVVNTGKTDLTLTVKDKMLNFEETISLKAGKTWTKDLTYKTTKVGTLVNTVIIANGKDETTASSDPTEVKKNDTTPVITPTLNKKDHVAYIIGYEDMTVRPENNITRAEVATIFFRLMDDSSRSRFWSQKNNFSDVSKNDWFNNAVSTMANAGILSGYPDGTFQPNAPITRAEFSAIAARFSDVVYGGKSSFSDVAKTFWAYEEIALAEHLGWITGYPDGTFQPAKNITRAEAMTMINRVLERAVEQEHMLKDMVHWTDNNPNAWYYEAVQEATNSHTYTRLNKKVSGQNFNYENWIKILENPDWAALEKSWSKN